MSNKHFKRGDRVVMTYRGTTNFRGAAAQCGVVVSCGHEPGLMRVKRDGLKNAETWHQSYWRKVTR